MSLITELVDLDNWPVKDKPPLEHIYPHGAQTAYCGRRGTPFLRPLYKGGRFCEECKRLCRADGWGHLL